MEHKYSFRFTQRAAEDYREIYQYISQELLTPQAAESFIANTESKIRMLCHMPYMGGMIGDSYLKKKGYRMLPIGNYIAFYIVKEDEETVGERVFCGYGEPDQAFCSLNA